MERIYDVIKSTDLAKQSFYRPAEYPELFHPVADVRLLYIDYTYQREDFSLRKVKQIAENFTFSAFQVVTCRKVDGKLVVIDGQHRVMAAILCGLKKIPVIEVKDNNEAELFLTINKGDNRVSAYSKHKAAAANGDNVALQTDAILAAYGMKPASINFIAALDKAVSSSPAEARLAFKFSKAVAGDDKILVAIFNGFFYLVRRGVVLTNEIPKLILMGGQNRIYARIKSRLADTLGLAIGDGGDRRRIYALAILDLVNKKKRNKITLPE